MKAKTTRNNGKMEHLDDLYYKIGQFMNYVIVSESCWESNEVILQFENKNVIPAFTFALDTLFAIRKQADEMLVKKN